MGEVLFMREKLFQNDPAPYSDSYEHIADVCHLMCSCMKPENSQESVAYAFDYLRIREDMSVDTQLPLVHIRRRFDLTGFQYMCVMLAVAAELEGSGDAPTFAIAAQHYPFFDTKEVYAAASANVLSYLLTIEPEGGMSRCFRLKSIVYSFITDGEINVPNISFCVRIDNLPIVYRDLYRQGVTFVRDSACCVILDGKQGSGRRTLAQQIIAERGQDCIIAVPDQVDNLTAFSDTLICLCIMTDSTPIILAEDNLDKALRLANLLPDTIPTIFVCCDGGQYDKPFVFKIKRQDLLRLKLTAPSEEQRLIVWKHYLSNSEIDVSLLARRYRLSVGQIAAAYRLAKDSISHEAIVQAVLSYNTSSGLAKIISPSFCMDDLIIDPHTKQQLNQIVRTVQSLPRLYDEGGFGKLYPYGRGVGVLLHGVSGTGKTMSAYILAAELGLDVMKVDLSQIEDKYIGETEKRMTEVFLKAEENNCLLFFDEADSLFAKRTEVTDSHDRHANGQTAHLLQKMEEYDGIVVLATNLYGNIDPAFKRRLPFIIGFARPDRAMREQLWRRFVPHELSKAELDFGYLADTFDLTPAEIKWAALSAAVYADGRLTMDDIFTALKYEYEKTNLTFPDRSYTAINL